MLNVDILEALKDRHSALLEEVHEGFEILVDHHVYWNVIDSPLPTPLSF